MNHKSHNRIESIINYLSTASDQHIERVYEFVIAVSEEKVVRTETIDGYLTYVFVENKND